MRVTVTEQHIRKGRKSNCVKCPIALALLEKRGVTGVSVSGNTASIYRRDHSYTYSTWYTLPAKAKEFIATFDSAGGTKKVSPFSFEMLPIPAFQ